MRRIHWMLALAFVPFVARSEEPASEIAKKCSLYRSKRDEVPVYAEPSTASEVLGHLGRSEKTCVVGEKGEFAIVRWDLQPAVREGRTVAGNDTLALGYIRLPLLWEPREGGSSPTNPLDPHTVTPDDPLWFLRPLLNLFSPSDPCADPKTVGCSPKR